MHIKPIYLLADSQLLFWREGNELFLKSLLANISSIEPIAAYIGASNGDNKVFFHLFESAMQQIGIRNNVMISSNYGKTEQRSLEKSDIILLAGGDTKKGWDTFTKTGIDKVVCERYSQGALIIGVSAGAVQLGTYALKESASGDRALLFNTFKLVPFFIDVHDEKSDWSNLRKVISQADDIEQGFGIRSGAGLIYHPDHSIEVIRSELLEVTRTGDELISKVLFPSRGVKFTTTH